MRKSQIYYNLNNSKYYHITGKFKYYFSSELYRTKFIERLESNREELKYKLSSRYNIEIEATDYFDFILYKEIEKRGYKILEIKTGGNILWENEIKLQGKMVLDLARVTNT